MNFRECYTPHVIGVNGVHTTDASQLAAFICTVAGTITVVDAAGITLLSAHPVAAGQYLPLPFLLISRTIANNASVVTLGGGAAGLLLL